MCIHIYMQVLRTLVSLLAKHGESQAKGNSSAALRRVVRAAAAEAAAENTALRVLRLRHLPHSEELASVSSLAYDNSVRMSGEELAAGEALRYLCLLEPPFPPAEVESAVDEAADGEGGTCSVVGASLAGCEMRCSAAATLAVVQHWAYNKRLVPVMSRLLEGAAPVGHEETATANTASLDKATTTLKKVKKVKKRKHGDQESTDHANDSKEALAEKKRRRKEKKAKKAMQQKKGQ